MMFPDLQVLNIFSIQVYFFSFLYFPYSLFKLFKKGYSFCKWIQVTKRNKRNVNSKQCLQNQFK